MKRKLMFVTVMLLLAFVITTVYGALTYNDEYYRKHRQSMGSGSTTSDPIYLFLNEIEGTLSGTEGYTTILLTPGSEPSATTEGLLYYDSAADTLKYRNASAWVTLDTAGGVTLDGAYDLGTGITVDNGAVTLTGTEAADNPVLSVVQQDTGSETALQITGSQATANAIGIDIDSQSTGRDIEGTGATWYVSGAGAAFFSGDFTLDGDAYDVVYDVSEDDLEFADGAGLEFGTGEDIRFVFDGSNGDLDITGTGLEIAFGVSDDGLDVVFHGETASTYALWDESADELLLDLADLKISQGSQIEFIDVTDSLTDWTIDNATDETLLFTPTETTDDQTINFGNATNTTDFRLFGATASTVVFDASGDKVTFDAYDMAFGDADIVEFGDSSDLGLSYEATKNQLELISGTDTAAIFQIQGDEGDEAQFILAADDDDDATDQWEFAALTTGSLTIGNDSAVADTFVDKLTIAGSTGNLTIVGDIINENGDTLVMSEDDTVSFQSDDADAVIQSYGYEAKEARLELYADEGDDATDAWEIASSTSGTLTIGNDSAVADTFVDKLTIAGATGNLTLTGDIVNENADTLVMSTDDTLQYTSDDTNATLQVLGFEASSAILSLDADQADDNADTWTHTVADGGAYTIANEGTATLTINERVAFGAGTSNTDVEVTDAAEYDVTAANSGKIHLITDMAQNTSIDLPAEADGLNYEFWYIGGAAEAHDHTIDSENNTNYFIGGVGFHDTDDGSVAATFSDGDSNSKFTINNASGGTIIKVTCDGTKWYITGTVVSDTAPAFADQ